MDYLSYGKEVKAMPGGDGTGPLGQGPSTGRGYGGCVPYGTGRRVFGGFGRAVGRGSRPGFGRRMPWNWFYRDSYDEKDSSNEEKKS